MITAYVGDKKQWAEPGLWGICPTCGDEVIAKCGDLKVWHWAHRSGTDCDSWSEPVGPWHLSWQKIVQPELVEVPMDSHRADIIGTNGIIIELQHSPISPEQIAEREDYYSLHGDMIWVFDATERFAMIKSGETAFFSWGQTRHIEACRKPIYLDFGNAIVKVDQLTKRLRRFDGFGAWGDREWFIDRYLCEVLQDSSRTGEPVPRKEPRSHPWRHRWPCFRAKQELTWFTPTGAIHSTPKGTECIPVRDYGLLEESPALANGWTAESRKIQASLFRYTELCIIEGLVRLAVWDAEPQPRLSCEAVKLAVEAAREHIRAGRMSIVEESVFQKLLAEAEERTVREYGERRDRKLRADQRRQMELF